MKRLNTLKGVRVLLALLLFIPILLFFVDFSGSLPSAIHHLLEAQVMPAVMWTMWGILLFHLLFTLVFGRLYCSTLCPAGVLQDIINNLLCRFRKKKNGTYRFSYHKPLNVLRYSILVLTGISVFAGVLNLYLLLDPYSNFGRIASNLFRPLVMWCNNGAAEVLMKMDNYSLYQVTINTVTMAGFLGGVIALSLFIGLTVWRGRLFCNTICPVGALLSLFSRYSLFRISFDTSSCTHCGLCERSCKAEAIDSKNMTVDTSRCVDCFNCISSCSKGGLQYRFRPVSLRKQSEAPENAASSCDNNRRNFLKTGATLATTLPAVSTLAQAAEGSHAEDPRKWQPITPPGSLSIERFKDMCTGCHLCVTQCPSQVLRPAGFEYGLGYLLKPHMSYKNSYCNYECTVCSDICPTHAIRPITKEESDNPSRHCQFLHRTMHCEYGKHGLRRLL
ncbi:MAG: 4Fe-4S binding protein [Phocaeicola vulgatus]|nr:MAG: 4Fe-4S binding protein [Phocaeicola vulgatus]